MQEPTSRILQHLRISCSTSCTSFMQLIVGKLDISTPPWSLDLPDGNSCDSFPSLMFRNLSSNGWFTLHLLLDGMYCLYMNMDGHRMSGERDLSGIPLLVPLVLARAVSNATTHYSEEMLRIVSNEVISHSLPDTSKERKQCPRVIAAVECTPNSFLICLSSLCSVTGIFEFHLWL